MFNRRIDNGNYVYRHEFVLFGDQRVHSHDESNQSKIKLIVYCVFTASKLTCFYSLFFENKNKQALNTADRTQQQRSRTHSYRRFDSPSNSSTSSNTSNTTPSSNPPPLKSVTTSLNKSPSNLSQGSPPSTHFTQILEMTGRSTASSRRTAATTNETGAPTGDSVSIPQAEYERLVDKGKNFDQVTKDLNKEKREYGKLDKAYGQLENKHDKLKQDHETLKESMQNKDKCIKELQCLVAELQQSLRKGGNVHESELNRELKEQTFQAAKIFLFRNVKWFQAHDDAEEHTKKCIEYLPKGKDSLGGLSAEEYGFMYRQVANKGLQAAKQSVQSEGKKAARGT